MVAVAGNTDEVVDVQDAEAVIDSWIARSGRAVPKSLRSEALRIMYRPGPCPGTAIPCADWGKSERRVKQLLRNCRKK